MDHSTKFSRPSFIGLVTVAVGMCIFAAGCTGPRQIVAPDSRELSMSDEGQSERDGVTLRATVLGKEQTKRLLNVDVASRFMLPVLFVMYNQNKDPLVIRREHFALRIANLRIEPALPGRAASLLRDSSESEGAIWAGYLVFGIFAAPSIDAAEKKETASVEGHRELIFSEAQLSPGGTIAGYLFFESLPSLKEVQRLDLELRISGHIENLISVQLPNHYRTPKGGPRK